MTDRQKFITPAPLAEGDKIAIVSPSGAVKAEYIRKSIPVLNGEGWEVEVSEHAYGRHGTYSGTAEERYDDLEKALLDPEVKAILCSRGGYGAVHLLERLDKLPLRDNPKWIIGFSDITALHALMLKHGIESVHGSMTSHLAETRGKDDDSLALFDILRGTPVTYRFAGNPRNKPGTATGRLAGGNLAVFADLIATPFDLLGDDIILFIEDVSEPIYKIERIMYQLRLMGVFDRIKGLIIGQFTEYSKDVDETSMENMIARMVEPYDIPVAFDAPIGHVRHNIPLIEGRMTTLTVTEASVEIEQ